MTSPTDPGQAPPQRLPHRLYDADGNPTTDRPWIFRTYAGHSSAAASNALYRKNLAAGQTGLSVAFDLPTQTGYSSDHPLALPEVGKVGVPINTIDDMHQLFEGIPLAEMNTSMTINATAMWLLALYIGVARERGEDVRKLQGTTQNDIIKEYLARGTYIFPPEASLRLIAEMYEYCLDNLPKWNASNICSYHLQEAGATPAQELAFALANAIGVLDTIRERGAVPPERFPDVVGRISFFVNSGIRFIEEMCKMRAFVELWDEITRDRYGVQDPKQRLFRYGVQVNSLGLTEQQPENNAWRILIEALGVTLSRKARCRALQLPAWNEALSLPRPWDQQWSLRLQQILAYETDLLEYPDIFDGSVVIESKTEELKRQAREEIARIEAMGGIRAAVESGYLKSQLVRSMSERVSKINSGELVIVGVNRWTEGLPSPLLTGEDGGIFKVDEAETRRTLEALAAVKANRDPARVQAALAALEEAARTGKNMMEPSIECALARVTTGEWADTLRRVFGEYRPPTGVEGQRLYVDSDRVAEVRRRAEEFVRRTGHRPRIVVGKPGLDGHSNGAEVIAVAARHCGFDVVYSGIRLTPEEIVQSAIEEAADVIGLSILSGSHLDLTRQVIEGLRAAGAGDAIPVIVGGIIPKDDHEALRALGARQIFTPADFDLADVMSRIMDVVEAQAGAGAR
ncbi:protein meaA [Tepidiforma flava]|uniref:Protein meaA n=1 Tax=Tepidiforma flava TaxID=3004094 RepID=A0ABY7MDK6_9CHLR|nr:protein meaA [Tepidiforma flava]WBL37436.1 protein meaA [Tepidiforma flava]